MGSKVPEYVGEDGDETAGQGEGRGDETVGVDSYEGGDEDGQGREVLCQVCCRGQQGIECVGSDIDYAQHVHNTRNQGLNKEQAVLYSNNDERSWRIPLRWSSSRKELSVQLSG